MTSGRSTIGFITHRSSLDHEMPAGHPERPGRITAITDHLDRIGTTDRLDRRIAEPVSRATLELVHAARYLDLLEAMHAAGGGRFDADTSMGPHTLDATLRATQAAVDAVGRVLAGEWTGAVTCMRPPGHHATPERAMGFCLTNHVAIAARWAIASGAAARVVILDWDAHHGNGTQEAFWPEPDVLYVSLHQYPWYPGTGDATERGSAEALGTTLNVPLPAGAAEDAYNRAIDEVIEPAVAAFAPDLVLVSAGYDAHHLDPLCMMRLSAGAFFRLARRVAAWAAGPVCVLEGGYDPDALAWSAAATVSALLGDDEPVGVPAGELDPLEGHPDAMRWVDRAAAIHS